MKQVFLAIIASVVLLGCSQDNFSSSPSFSDQNIQNSLKVEEAYKNHETDIQVRGSGTVTRMLSDDNKGSRHQRFILQLSSGGTILIVHNIDIAPKIETLQKGDKVVFYGEYVWNSKGGLVHWTHHDPNGKHLNGWLKYNGRKYD